MSAIIGAAVFGLVPVPMIPAFCAYVRHGDHRPATTAEADASQLAYLGQEMATRMARTNGLAGVHPGVRTLEN
jgi:hypothetical protein